MNRLSLHRILTVLFLPIITVSGFATTFTSSIALRASSAFSTPTKAVQRRGLSLNVCMGNGFEGELVVEIKRNFGDKFFLKGRYMNENRPAPREWQFQRTWADFVVLEKAIRTDRKLSDNGGMNVSPLPPEPYLLGEDASFLPFQKYLDEILAIKNALQSPYVYEFVNAPDSVLTQAMPGLVAIDVAASGEVRYNGESSKYSIPVLDPVILASQAGKTYSQVNKALKEAEIAKNSGKALAEIRLEGQKAAGAVAEEVGAVVGEVTKVVNSSSTGKALGGMLGNLRAGKGIFGEKSTMAFSRAVIKTTGIDKALAEEEEPVKYTDKDKWTLIVTGPTGEPLEVTVKPVQKAKLLLKAWLAENDLEGGFKLVGDPEGEIGQLGVRDGGIVEVVAK